MEGAGSIAGPAKLKNAKNVRRTSQIQLTYTMVYISRNNLAIPDFLCSKCCDHKVEGYYMKKGMIAAMFLKVYRPSFAIYAEHALKQKIWATK